MIFIFVLGLCLGICIGRAYGWMKYHYPEFSAEMDMRVARKRAEQARYESDEIGQKLRGQRYYDEVANDH